VIDAGVIAVLAPFLMVVGIVWVRSKAQLEEKRIEAGRARGESDSGLQTVNRVDELEERVRILERIVTDRGYDVATQIEALRDRRAVETRVDATQIEERI
jgi:hypothetical protein